LNCVRIGYHPSQSVRLFVQPLRPSGYGCPGSRLWDLGNHNLSPQLVA
jgi:hypothetical protein